MAKIGLDYFSLSCNFDDKLELIEAECGLKGLAIVVKLLQRIYGEFGYYCVWNDEVALLFSRKNCGLQEGDNVVSEVIKTAVRRGFFDSNMYQKYGILTSAGIQKRYFEAVQRRKEVEVLNEYLLLSARKIPPNAYIIKKNACNGKENVSRNEQSKVKESNRSCPSGDGRPAPTDALEQQKNDFEIIYGIYPKKAGRSKAFEHYRSWLKGRKINGEVTRLSNRQMYSAVKKYVFMKQEEGQDDLKFWKNFDTLMNKSLLDYIPQEGRSE